MIRFITPGKMSFPAVSRKCQMSPAVLPANSIFPGKLNSQEKLPEAVAEFPASVIAKEALFYSQ